ncbi:MAG: glycosyltransferase family 39 protein, partial [Anaerolineae bacterium]
MLLTLCGVTLLALVLRLHRLAGQSIWWDEGWSVALARMSVAQLAESTAHDVHPPLYYLALQGWTLLTGESEFALRFLSLWFGVSIVPLTYRLGRAVLSPGAGLMAALLVAVSPFCVAWSQETRMYVVATALGIASTWLAVRLWREGRGFWPYLLTGVALLYTLYLGIVFIMVQNLAWLALQVAERGRSWRRWAAAQVALVLCLAPWLAFALALTRTWSAADPVGLGRLLYYYWGAVVTGTSAYIESHTALLVGLAACFLASIAWLAWRPLLRGWWRPVLLFAGALLPPLVVFVMSQPRSFLYSPRPEPRYLNPFAPLVFLLWACGIAVAW